MKQRGPVSGQRFGRQCGQLTNEHGQVDPIAELGDQLAELAVGVLGGVAETRSWQGGGGPVELSAPAQAHGESRRQVGPGATSIQVDVQVMLGPIPIPGGRKGTVGMEQTVTVRFQIRCGRARRRRGDRGLF